MSLQLLLTDFPNYSARKIRRLAKQLAFVEEAEKTATEPSVSKGIAADLMEFNLQQARTEAQLNDDTPTPHPDVPPTEFVVVTPVKEAMRAIDEIEKKFANYVHLAEMPDTIKRAKGLVSGSAFTVERQR